MLGHFNNVYAAPMRTSTSIGKGALSQGLSPRAPILRQCTQIGIKSAHAKRCNWNNFGDQFLLLPATLQCPRQGREYNARGTSARCLRAFNNGASLAREPTFQSAHSKRCDCNAYPAPTSATNISCFHISDATRVNTSTGPRDVMQ